MIIRIYNYYDYFDYGEIIIKEKNNIWGSMMKTPFLGDVIIKEGCVGTKMYFIQEGIVDIVMGTGEGHII